MKYRLNWPFQKATLKIYKGGGHGMCTTQKDEVNKDLLEFIKR